MRTHLLRIAYALYLLTLAHVAVPALKAQCFQMCYYNPQNCSGASLCGENDVYQGHFFDAGCGLCDYGYCDYYNASFFTGQCTVYCYSDLWSDCYGFWV